MCVEHVNLYACGHDDTELIPHLGAGHLCEVIPSIVVSIDDDCGCADAFVRNTLYDYEYESDVERQDPFCKRVLDKIKGKKAKQHPLHWPITPPGERLDYGRDLTSADLNRQREDMPWRHLDLRKDKELRQSQAEICGWHGRFKPDLPPKRVRKLDKEVRRERQQEDKEEEIDREIQRLHELKERLKRQRGGGSRGSVCECVLCEESLFMPTPSLQQEGLFVPTPPPQPTPPLGSPSIPSELDESLAHVCAACKGKELFGADWMEHGDEESESETDSFVTSLEDFNHDHTHQGHEHEHHHHHHHGDHGHDHIHEHLRQGTHTHNTYNHGGLGGHGLRGGADQPEDRDHGHHENHDYDYHQTHAHDQDHHDEDPSHPHHHDVLDHDDPYDAVLISYVRAQEHALQHFMSQLEQRMTQSEQQMQDLNAQIADMKIKAAVRKAKQQAEQRAREQAAKEEEDEMRQQLAHEVAKLRELEEQLRREREVADEDEERWETRLRAQLEREDDEREGRHEHERSENEHEVHADEQAMGAYIARHEDTIIRAVLHDMEQKERRAEATRHQREQQHRGAHEYRRHAEEREREQARQDEIAYGWEPGHGLRFPRDGEDRKGKGKERERHRE